MNFRHFSFILPFISLLFLVLGCNPRQDVQEEAEVKKILSFKKEIAGAQAEEKNGDLLLARKHYKELLANISQPQEAEAIKKKIEELNINILFSDIVEKDSFLYQIAPGDSLGEIAKKFNTTIELLKKSNGLDSDMIRMGDTLKVLQADFSAVVDKSQNILFLKKNDEIFKTYVVSTGKDNSTPTGTFKIVTKIKNPTWFRKDIGAVVPPDSPDNILGSRWLGFDAPGYGIHGTTQPDNLGTHETKGCVRMRNEEVEELFAIIPRGTQVMIVE